uniref:Uncharacterized protein n=1 Tax=Anguilla anguilla TaxID=7936 RepID=A0A0E9PER4_ANGAN
MYTARFINASYYTWGFQNAVFRHGGSIITHNREENSKW